MNFISSVNILLQFWCICNISYRFCYINLMLCPGWDVICGETDRAWCIIYTESLTCFQCVRRYIDDRLVETIFYFSSPARSLIGESSDEKPRKVRLCQAVGDESLVRLAGFVATRSLIALRIEGGAKERRSDPSNISSLGVFSLFTLRNSPAARFD